MANNDQPIIIKKISKGHGGHHGGAWKLAYADFVTAMMAFFLLMWLLNATTEDQRLGLADFFSPTPGVLQSTTGGEGVASGESVVTEGAFTKDKASPGVMVMIPDETTPDEDITEEEAEDVVAKKEEDQFEEAEAAIRDAMEETPELRELANNLIIDQTPEGLRIQIVDQEGSAMFKRGSTSMTPKARTVIAQVVKAIAAMPNKLTITGNTDASQFARYGYDNWDLSTDRANSSRRAMLRSGLHKDRIFRVTGRASEDLLDKEDPTAPINRRISIVLLRDSYLKKFEQVEETDAAHALKKAESGTLAVTPVEEPPQDKPEPEAAPEGTEATPESMPESMPEPAAHKSISPESVPKAPPEAAPMPEPAPESATEPAPEAAPESATEPAPLQDPFQDPFQNIFPDGTEKESGATENAPKIKDAPKIKKETKDEPKKPEAKINIKIPQPSP